RLDDLRLVAVEERIEAEIVLGRAADVVSELDSLAREHPLRERLCELRMRALYAAGRQADALEAYTAVRKALDELGIEPGERLKELQSSILRHAAGLSPKRNGCDVDADVEITRAILSGRLVPVLGLDGAADLAAGAAPPFGCPGARPPH